MTERISDTTLDEIERLRAVAKARPRSFGANGRYFSALDKDFPALLQELREARRMRQALELLANEDSYKPMPDSVCLQVINIAKTALKGSGS